MNTYPKITSPFLDELREYRNRNRIQEIRDEFHWVEAFIGACFGFGIAVIVMVITKAL